MDPECPICGHQPCDSRSAGTLMQPLWRTETLTCDGPHKTPPPPCQKDDEPSS